MWPQALEGVNALLSEDKSSSFSFLFFSFFFFFPLAQTEKINTPSLATDNLQCRLQSRTTGAQKREAEEKKMTSEIDLVWVEVRAKTARNEAPLGPLVKNLFVFVKMRNRNELVNAKLHVYLNPNAWKL